MNRLFLVLLAAASVLCAADRTVLSLDGTWDIADSVAAETLPTSWTHKAPVPGLAHSATPAFPDVDEFDSREVLVNRVNKGWLPRERLVQNAGVSRQKRNYFWYRTTFTAPAKRSVATLRINKAQFGTAVWLNGTKVGEHLPCFSAAILNVTSAVRWQAANELVVRVGAHPGVLPEQVVAGTDFEKNRWTPGIYDRVSIGFSDNPVIETVQVAPRIQSSEILVQTKVRNYGATPAAFDIAHTVSPWKSSAVAARSTPRKLSLAAGEERTLTETIPIPGARLWSPEEPNLYVLQTSTGGDSATTRFGMREFRFDTATRRAFLNGKVYFMRGSNVTLHRFFEDPKSGTLPWDEKWLQKLLVEIPKQMNWNSFRFCIGPAPERWLEIADEAGLLIQNEYFIWTGKQWHGKDYIKTFDAPQLIREFSEWMRDNWNHPSVVIWDANNETWDPVFGEKVIPAVRGLDLSNRPWENSYNPPVGPDDPIEDHPYEYHAMSNSNQTWSMMELERRRLAPARSTAHPMILNEYGWLWLNRDGSPTELTRDLYPKLLGPNSTAEERFALNAYLLGGVTEYWRAHRHYAGVLHFVYLTSSDPKAFTADHFRDVEKLELEPHFADYLSHAFKPLGVYVNFWQPQLTAGTTREIHVLVTNDDPQQAAGTLALVLEDESGREVARQQRAMSVAGLGQSEHYFNFDVPSRTGKFILKAIAHPSGARHSGDTLSRRKVELVQAKK